MNGNAGLVVPSTGLQLALIKREIAACHVTQSMPQPKVGARHHSQKPYGYASPGRVNIYAHWRTRKDAPVSVVGESAHGALRRSWSASCRIVWHKTSRLWLYGHSCQE